MPVANATLLSILGAYLLLPAAVEVDLPLIPPLDKFSISNLAAYISCSFILGKRIKLLPNFGLVRVLLFIYIFSPFVTSFLNPEPIFAGSRIIKGMEYYDALSAVIRQLIFILPFILGFNFLRKSENHEKLFHVLVISCLIYSIPMLIEIRLSPQIHRWIYGYFPHSFAQQIRAGGFRPVVFLGHGLLVAFFTMSALVAATALGKMRNTINGYNLRNIAIYLSVILFLCKSVASILYAIFLVFTIRLGKTRFQVQIAKMIVIFVLLYPMMRVFEVFPITPIQELATEFSEKRAQSLQFRFDNEELLLDHARDHSIFGWGSWGRNRVYDKKSGKDLAVTDGRWIIVLGIYGWVGYIAEFGLLIIPVIYSAKSILYVRNKKEKIVLAAMALLMAISVVDLLPNSTVAPWTWLMAGALLGRVDEIKSNARNEKISKKQKQVREASFQGS